MGPAYLSREGIPSKLDKGDHDFHSFHAVEQDANRRAFKYFNKEVGGFQNDTEIWNEHARDNLGWDFWRNPLNVNGSNQRGQYVDYRNPDHMRLLNNLAVRSTWYDYFGTVLIPGIINTLEYNN